jgi:hypothetical protein
LAHRSEKRDKALVGTNMALIGGKEGGKMGKRKKVDKGEKAGKL